MTDTRDLVLDVDVLHAMFGHEENYGDIDAPEDGESTFADGTPTVFCTNWATYVRRCLGERAALWGFFSGDNPTSRISGDCDGHDFAIVDGRYIVDGWASCVESYLQVAAIDMEDPAMQETIANVYGDWSLWKRNEDLENEVDSELPDDRATYMANTGFLDEYRARHASPTP